MEIIKNYRNNEILRHSFNKLSENTFGINFESWYQNGFWNDLYIPYSIAENNEIIANVSVNLIDIRSNERTLHLIQLGTVMTKEEYRNQGLIRKIINEIEKDFSDKVDGMFLFANNEVLDFYPKFGFKKAKEFQYSKQVNNTQKTSIKHLPMKCKNEWDVLVNAINSNKFCGEFDMTNNSDLVMFYVSNFMQDNIYYNDALNAYVIAEIDGKNLFIHNVFADSQIELDNIIASFGDSIKSVTLGFVPKNANGYEVKELKEDDTTLFLRGFSFENKKLMFPTLSHA